MTDVPPAPADIWRRLDHVLTDRIENRSAGSYVAELLDGGHSVQCGKVIEEAYELVEACGGDERTAVIHESADLMFHLLVLLRTHDVQIDDIEAELARRFGLGGLTEKKSRAEGVE